MIRNIAVVLGILAFAYLLVDAVFEIPPFGFYGSDKEVADYYIWHGLSGTGSANIVNSVVWDFRGYDTLGEEMVLFSAALGAFLLLEGGLNGRDN
jgi:multicomponent Na+:H+ antiporter subunit B